MLHDLRGDYIRRRKPSLFNKVASFAKYAAIWLLVSFAVTALVWASCTYSGPAAVSDPAGYFPWATPGAG
ncbi:MAG: hypothetical protein ACLPX9_05925 [Rhodomicrobium sp.]